MSKSMRTQLKLFSILYNKSPNICLLSLKFDLKTNLWVNKQMCDSMSFRCFSYSSNRNQKLKSNSNSLSETQNTSQTELTIGEKVKQTTQDISYFGNYLIIELMVKLLIETKYEMFRRYISGRFGDRSYIVCHISRTVFVGKS